MNTRINHVAVWVMVVVHCLIGFGWYAAFGEVWLRLHAKTMTDIEVSDVAHVVAIACAIIVNYALAWLIGRLNATSALGGLKVALFCWFSFLFVEYATVSAFSAFGRNPWPLIFFDMGRPFLKFAVSGLVLGGWRRRVSTPTA